MVTPGTYRSCSFAQLGPGRPATLTTCKQKVVFCFLGFLPGAVVLVLATGRQQCPCPQWSDGSLGTGFPVILCVLSVPLFQASHQ